MPKPQLARFGAAGVGGVGTDAIAPAGFELGSGAVGSAISSARSLPSE